MDWFYPILCGALDDVQAEHRINRYWEKFIVHGEGTRCVYDEPWVTIAETSELCLSLDAMGKRSDAKRLYHWIVNKRFSNGTFWCGHTVPDKVVWPEEHITWTNAVVMMATDALYDLTPAAKLFHHQSWGTAPGEFLANPIARKRRACA